MVVEVFMRPERFNVDLQGVTPDLMQANGSYDAVTFKNLSAQRIAEILEIISQLCPPDGDDVCPINLTVTSASGDHTFTVFDDSGQIYCADPEGTVTIEQAIIMITGQKPDFAISGPPQVNSVASASVCANCQAKIEPDESFCGNCGQAVVRHAPPPPPSAPSLQTRPTRKATKKAPVDQQTYDSIVGLMAKPIRFCRRGLKARSSARLSIPCFAPTRRQKFTPVLPCHHATGLFVNPGFSGVCLPELLIFR
jgi:hypothetical protein